MNWILFSILAAFVWALGNVLDKYIFNKWIKEPNVALLFFGFFGLISSLIVFWYSGFTYLNFHQLTTVGLVGFVYVVACKLYYTALKSGEVSVVVPLIYLDPLFTAMFAGIFINELFPAYKYIGVCLIVFGAMLISFKDAGSLKLNKAVGLAVLSAIFFGAYNVILKSLLSEMNFWKVFAYVRFSTFVFLIPLYFVYFKQMVMILKQPKAFSVVGVSNVFSFTGILFYTLATSLTFITFTSTLTALQPFFVLMITLFLSIFAPKIFKEETSRRHFVQKVAAVVLMFVGIYLTS
jgi:transporter family protein